MLKDRLNISPSWFLSSEIAKYKEQDYKCPLAYREGDVLLTRGAKARLTDLGRLQRESRDYEAITAENFMLLLGITTRRAEKKPDEPWQTGQAVEIIFPEEEKKKREQIRELIFQKRELEGTDYAVMRIVEIEEKTKKISGGRKYKLEITSLITAHLNPNNKEIFELNIALPHGISPAEVFPLFNDENRTFIEGEEMLILPSLEHAPQFKYGIQTLEKLIGKAYSYEYCFEVDQAIEALQLLKMRNENGNRRPGKVEYQLKDGHLNTHDWRGRLVPIFLMFDDFAACNEFLEFEKQLSSGPDGTYKFQPSGQALSAATSNIDPEKLKEPVVNDFVKKDNKVTVNTNALPGVFFTPAQPENLQVQREFVFPERRHFLEFFITNRRPVVLDKALTTELFYLGGLFLAGETAQMSLIFPLAAPVFETAVFAFVNFPIFQQRRDYYSPEINFLFLRPTYQTEIIIPERRNRTYPLNRREGMISSPPISSFSKINKEKPSPKQRKKRVEPFDKISLTERRLINKAKIPGGKIEEKISGVIYLSPPSPPRGPGGGGKEIEEIDQKEQTIFQEKYSSQGKKEKETKPEKKRRAESGKRNEKRENKTVNTPREARRLEKQKTEKNRQNTDSQVATQLRTSTVHRRDEIRTNKKNYKTKPFRGRSQPKKDLKPLIYPKIIIPKIRQKPSLLFRKSYPEIGKRPLSIKPTPFLFWTNNLSSGGEGIAKESWKIWGVFLSSNQQTAQYTVGLIFIILINLLSGTIIPA